MTAVSKNTLFIFTFFAGLLLSTLCIALPVLQWSSLGSSTTLKVVIGSAALGMGICKLTFFPLSAWHIKRKSWVPGLALLFIACVALVMSVFATAALIENLISDKKHTAQTKSIDYQLWLKNINVLDDQINNLNTLVTNDIANNYRTRALKQQEKVDDLYRQRQVFIDQLDNKTRATHAADKIGLGGDFLPTRLWGEVTIKPAVGASAALHIAGVFALLAITAWWPAPVEASALKTIEPPPKQPLTETKAVIRPEQTPEKTLMEDQQRLASKIVNGDFGRKPSLRNIIADKDRGIKGGYKRVKPVFDYLLSNDLIKPSGRGYELSS